MGLFASKMFMPWYAGTSAVNRPCGSTGSTISIPAASVTTLSSSPNAGAMCTMPVPSSVVT